MHRLWQKQPSSQWVPLELACRDLDFMIEVRIKYSSHFSVPMNMLEIRMDDEEFDMWSGMSPEVTAEVQNPKED